MAKRSYGDGGIYTQGKNSWRLRYRVRGKRFNKTSRESSRMRRKSFAACSARAIPANTSRPITSRWQDGRNSWIEVGAPGRKKQAVGARAIERYDQLLRTHVLPTLGERKLQKIDSTEIDKLYLSLEGKIAPRTARHVHSVLNACLGAAVRTKKLTINPMESTRRSPPPAKAITASR